MTWTRTKAWHDRHRPIYDRVKARLRANAPDIFDSQKPVPLKIDAHKEMAAKYAGIFDEREIATFLIFWTGRREYQIALALGEKRHGLDSTTDILTRDHADFALKRLSLRELAAENAALLLAVKEAAVVIAEIAKAHGADPMKGSCLPRLMQAIAKSEPR